jgi:hypothetical protein
MVGVVRDTRYCRHAIAFDRQMANYVNKMPARAPTSGDRDLLDNVAAT